VEAAGIEPAS